MIEKEPKQEPIGDPCDVVGELSSIFTSEAAAVLADVSEVVDTRSRGSCRSLHARTFSKNQSDGISVPNPSCRAFLYMAAVTAANCSPTAPEFKNQVFCARSVLPGTLPLSKSVSVGILRISAVGLMCGTSSRSSG